MKGVIEGLLYVQGDQGLTIDEVADILEIDKTEAKELILSLKQDYIDEDRGLRINYLGNSFKLTTKEEALETLAIIAYNEPITRLAVDEIRGVDSVYVMRRLLAKGLIKECGRSDLPGRPILYKTTDEFLDYFGLASKEDLPKIDILENIDEEKDLFKSTYKEEE